MNKIRELISNNVFGKEILYLLDIPKTGFCFFYQDGIVFFAKENSTVSQKIAPSRSIKYLQLSLNVTIESLSLDNSLKSGNYDLLAFKGDINERYFDTFYELCLSYCNNDNQMSFESFFLSLLELFQLEKAGSFENLIGLLGELWVIKYLFENKNVNITEAWHKTGSKSKFDFCFKNFNIEVKATVKAEKVFLIKHKQIFNNQKVYVGIVNLIETGTGMSINSFKQFFIENKFFDNLDFQLRFQKECMKINETDLSRSFSLDMLDFYFTEELTQIKDIPSCISNISYEYDFSDFDTCSIDGIISKIDL